MICYFFALSNISQKLRCHPTISCFRSVHFYPKIGDNRLQLATTLSPLVTGCLHFFLPSSLSQNEIPPRSHLGRQSVRKTSKNLTPITTHRCTNAPTLSHTTSPFQLYQVAPSRQKRADERSTTTRPQGPVIASLSPTLSSPFGVFAGAYSLSLEA